MRWGARVSWRACARSVARVSTIVLVWEIGGCAAVEPREGQPGQDAARNADASVMSQDVEAVGRGDVILDIGDGILDIGTVVVDAETVVVDAGAVVVDAGLAERRCVLQSREYGEAMRVIDVGPGSGERLRFRVNGVPAGSTGAVLHFDSLDADHPGQEGWISLGGRGHFAIPANTRWDNVTVRDNQVEVSSAITAGDTVVEFGPGPLERSHFGIAAVSIELTARVAVCPGEPSGPTDAGALRDAGPTLSPVERTLGYGMARYTNRFNWVFRCSANYAYTARGSDHESEDCDGEFHPDGTLRGTATFTFTNVIAGRYDIVVTSRHSANRNTLGALFIVNGERGRINQRDDRGGLSLWQDIWGRRDLAGTVTVTLDSSNNNGSDSVSSVTLRPVR